MLSVLVSSITVRAESMDTGSRIAMVAGSVFGVWLGQKLFHKKEKKSTESIQKPEVKKETVSPEPVTSP